MGLRLAATAVAAAVVLAGCGGAPAPSSSPTASASADPMAPGTCFNPSMRDPGPSVAVPCGRRHRFEVLARQDLPLEYFGDEAPTRADRATLQAALDGSTDAAMQVKFASYAHAYCAIALQRLSGLDQADFAKADIAAVQATVHTEAWAPVAFLNTGRAWLRQPLLTCANRFAKPVSGSRTAKLLTASVPIAQRSCFEVHRHERPVPCDRPHDGENALDFDATPLLSPEQLSVAKAATSRPLPAAIQDILDAACQATLPRLIGDGYDKAHVTARAVRDASGWGRGGYRNLATCQFVPAKGATQLPAGSLFGIGDRDVPLVQR